MFSDDEDELELLRQYGDRDLHADDDEGHSSDDMDSDLEDKIMSMVQFNKKVPSVEKPEEPKVVYAPIGDNAEKQDTNFSSANELQLSEKEEGEEDSDAEDIGTLENPSTPEDTDIVMQPQVTRYIDLGDKRYMDDEETDEEEAELNAKLQDLIDEQISKRQSRVKYVNKPIRVCFGCHQPGHDRRDCNLCGDCGGPKHADSRCVGFRYCGRCKMRGHNQADCTNPRVSKSCQVCYMSYHNALNCPSLLHVYENESPPSRIPTAYCYYCTEKGHYGDDCPDLPKYLTTVPSVFSYLSLTEGSRFDPKKQMKSSASSFSASSTSHQRWSDSSRESSPRRNNDYSNDRGFNNGAYKRRYNDSDNESNKRNRYNDRYDDSDHYEQEKKKTYKGNIKPSSYKDDSAGGKRRRTDIVDNSRSNLDNFFTSEKKKKGKDNYNYSGKSGNNNWKAVNNSLPQPTRSGTVNLNKKRQQQNYDGDFPRGNGSDLPRPSSSGVIDLTKSDSGGYSKRAPKYHGGYNRR
ncbi:hypothetical protein INT47_012287 [Mucor saturninus]|uniref:CCHC-type domain-containing protein n=1 Tax=Mucor saturninus TaxID=64648 RepID=A0A8H7VAH0_9FUNG|nr:hypothetical protein INT47_012287 [Mucor saturninus]